MRTSIAKHLSLKGYQVQILCNEIETAKSIQSDHVSSLFFPDILHSETLGTTTDLLDIIRNESIFTRSNSFKFYT